MRWKFIRPLFFLPGFIYLVIVAKYAEPICLFISFGEHPPALLSPGWLNPPRPVLYMRSTSCGDCRFDLWRPPRISSSRVLRLSAALRRSKHVDLAMGSLIFAVSSDCHVNAPPLNALNVSFFSFFGPRIVLESGISSCGMDEIRVRNPSQNA